MAADTLVAAAVEAGGKDNVSVIVVDVSGAGPAVNSPPTATFDTIDEHTQDDGSLGSPGVLER